MAGDDGEVFTERLLQVIDEGRRTATYKLALLLALIDACAEGTDASGRAPEVLDTRTIARHVLRIYLPQIRVFLVGGEERRLRQIRADNSAVVNAALRLHLAGSAQGVHRPSDIERQLPEEYERCLGVVEHTFARYPLLLLQKVGSQERPFLYDVEKGGCIVLRPGAGDRLLRLAPLVRPLIEVHWVRMVADLNGIDVEGERLRQHLFGVGRVSLPASLRDGLVALQDGACFYCGDRLGATREVDHVIPWSRWPNDAVENLVVADRCNGHKRDCLPALQHIDKWIDRYIANHGELVELARSTRWETDPARTIALARTAYGHLPAGTPLWAGRDDFTFDDPALVTRRLAEIDLAA